jgi:hypothetical protein
MSTKLDALASKHGLCAWGANDRLTLVTQINNSLFLRQPELTQAGFTAMLYFGAPIET